MKKWRKQLAKIPKQFRQTYGFNVHMRERPKGVSRPHWIAVWMEQHAANWPITDRVAVSKIGIPRVELRNHKLSPRVRHRTKKVYAVAATQRPDFLQSFEWRQLRMRVLKARGARCECCGASPTDGVTVINVDHIKPRCDFPELALSESNLQVLCAPCNHGKGNWDHTDWRPKAPSPELPANWNEPLWTKPN